VEDTSQWAFEPAPAPAPAPAPQPRTAPRGGTDALAGLAAELANRPQSYPEHTAPQPRMPAQAPMAVAEPAAASADQNLADMAQRLEAALRRPGATAPAERPAAKPAPVAAPVPAAATNGAARPSAEPMQLRAEPRHAEPSVDDKKAFTSLEEEMASLLGRKG
jgi:hypothetical protein